MKNVTASIALAILFLGMLFTARSSIASIDNKHCSADVNSAHCQAYVAGLVDGYLNSKQNYLPRRAVFDSKLENRALSNRVSNVQYSRHLKTPACVPQDADREQIAAMLTQAFEQSPQDLSKLSLNALLNNAFPCD